MALMGLKGIMKQKTLGGPGGMPGGSFMPPPAAGIPAQPAFPAGGLLKKRAPSQSTEVKSGLMKRLTGK